MRQFLIREMRASLGNLDRLVAETGEIVVTRHGKPVARVLPIQGAAKRPGNHSKLRNQMPRLDVPSEILLREDRDQR